MEGGKEIKRPEPIGLIIGILFVLNVASLILYSVEYHRTGTVKTSSSREVQGYHEIPAILAFLTIIHQLGFNPYKNKFSSKRHRIIGMVGIASSVVCLCMALKNVSVTIRLQFYWASKEVFPIHDLALRHFFMVWNETVNIHQFMIYGGLFMNQLWQGYHTAKNKMYRQHEQHMKSATMFLLGPLAQRFLFNHVMGKVDELAVYLQVTTYTILMAMLATSKVARPSIHLTFAFAFFVANIMVNLKTSVLVYLLAAVEQGAPR